jgi:septal ring factor EnvC (AmiA/AmiB activator)
MVDAVTVLQGIQELDKWRRRVEVLERSLGDIRERRRRLQTRLRKLERDVARLRALGDSMVDLAARPSQMIEVHNAPRGPLL